ncbi:MAG: hypothetical protein PHH85_00590 [Candidatus Methanoperedens sp.]|nr:hypothetical protein [Candidatus Methanoperedens sp.]
MDILRKISKKVPVALIFTLFIGFLLILLSPEDKELGAILKLIYLHGALITAGLSLFTAAGLVSLISLFRGRMKFKMLFAIEKTAVIFWVAATIIGDLTSVLAWGGINPGEPRFAATIIVSLISVGVYFISTSIDDRKIISLLGIGLAVSVWVIMGSAGKILHPDNPFSASEQSIKTFFFLISLVFLAASVLTVRWIKKMET